MTLAAVLFAAIISTTVFAACSSDDDDAPIVVSYSAEGNISSFSTSLDGSNGLFVIPGFNSAIASVLGGENYIISSNTSEKDAAVKSACDAYYSEAKVKYTNVKGTVTIIKAIGSEGNSKKSTLATYTFE